MKIVETAKKLIAAIFRSAGKATNAPPIDYHGNRLYLSAANAAYYPLCENCNRHVWHQHIVFGLCPLCLLGLRDLEFEISFSKSASKSHGEAVKTVMSSIFYFGDIQQNIHGVRFWNTEELFEGIDTAMALHEIASNWKSYRVHINGAAVSPRQFLVVMDNVKRVIMC